ncbi:hypothetical protein QOZ80_6AG0543690 [Eleusine coracana subsp. coracana]|nr:hypothetical protein QOZ80_6AG0543690 [Eleusine coracana subsp. coracana]
MFTGRNPTEENFEADLNLQSFVEAGYPDHVEGVVEQNLIQPIEDIEGGQNRILNKEVMLSCITSILRVGLLCSKQLPEERMQISEAVRELQKIKQKFYPRRNNVGTNQNQILERTHEQAY